jgi:RecA-family ATPase
VSTNGKTPPVSSSQANPKPVSLTNKSIPDWRKKLNSSELTSTQIKNLSSAKLLVNDIPIMQGQLTYLYGFPGCGKTAFAMKLAALATNAGCEVHYFQVDVSAADLKDYHQLASRAGFMIHSTMADNTSLKSLHETVFTMAEEATAKELSNMVIILDTYKKFTADGDVNNKKANVHMFATLRQLTMKGATVLILGHANKARDDDQMPIFSGTQEIQDDSDALISLNHMASPDGKQIRVNAEFKKARSMHDQSWGFIVHRGSSLIHNQVELGVPFDSDIQKASQQSDIRSRNKELIETILTVLAMHPASNQTKVVQEVRQRYNNQGLSEPGEKKIRFVLNNLDGDDWTSTVDKTNNNAKVYTMNQTGNVNGPPNQSPNRLTLPNPPM